MALQIVVDYHNHPVTYNVISEERHIYRLLLEEGNEPRRKSFIPSKINIRRKGKIWISDLEDSDALVQALMLEIHKFHND
ncbi:MAG: hypothetical protein JWP88_331 [Flaviaesturariibacter sp.]|nr:hypothetical protein [Flaviaesturariibacter sp.]